MNEITEKTIDIKAILRGKMGEKAKWVPRPLVEWLRKIAHEDEVNAFLWSARDKTGVPWLEATLEYLDTTLDIHGMENLPPKGDGRRYTFVANHPLGGQDGVAIGAIIGRHYDGNIRYLVNDLLMNLPGLAPLCIPINKTGKQSRRLPEMIEQGFASPYHMLMFPAGLNSRRINGKIHDLPWKKTFIQKSVETQRDVIPIHFSGRNSDRFYNVANWQKRLGLKVNIAMLLLVDEMYRNRHKTFRIDIGKPIPWQTFDHSKTAAQWALHVEELVYQLDEKQA